MGGGMSSMGGGKPGHGGLPGAAVRSHQVVLPQVIYCETLKLQVASSDPLKFAITVQCQQKVQTDDENYNLKAVKGLKICVTEEATFTKAEKIHTFHVPDTHSSDRSEIKLQSYTGQTATCVVVNKSGKEFISLEIPCYRTLTLSATATNANPSRPIVHNVDPTGKLHSAGGEIKTLLSGRVLVKKSNVDLSWGQKKDELDAKIREKNATNDLAKLLKWLADKFKEDEEEAAKKYPIVISQLRDRTEVIKEAVDDAVAWAFAQLPEFVADQIPFLGQILIGAKVVTNAAGAGASAWKAHTMFGAEKLITNYRVSERPQTPEAFFNRLGTYFEDKAYESVETAVARLAEFGLSFAPGAGSVVKAASNMVRVINRVVSNFREARHVDITNWMLKECVKYHEPDDYYHTIRCGHPALMCYLIDSYGVKSTSRPDQVKDAGIPKFIFWEKRVRDEVEKNANNLVDKASTVEKTLRFKLGQPEEQNVQEM